MSTKVPVMGIILGDHAGIGPEIAAMALCREDHADSAIVLVGNRSLFERSMGVIPDRINFDLVDITDDPAAAKEAGKVYFYDIPVIGEVPFSKVTAASGQLIFDSIQAALRLERQGALDGIVMGPITKQALHAAGLNYSSEFEIFSEYYQIPNCCAVIKAGKIYRCTVVGHVRFTEIVNRLTPEGIKRTAHFLRSAMKRFMPEEEIKLAVAALNPHAGEDGLFGDEESTIIQPAVDDLRAEGLNVVGPVPADTVYFRAQTGRVNGIVYLYHDQGNIAMKAASFGEGVLIYMGVPSRIVSVGHGGAFGSAGKGTATPQNIIASISALKELIGKEA